MNVYQFINELTQWFDFSMRTVSHHPVISLTAVLVAFLFYQALSVMKFIGTMISFGLAMVMAILLKMLMS